MNIHESKPLSSAVGAAVSPWGCSSRHGDGGSEGTAPPGSGWDVPLEDRDTPVDAPGP